MGARAPYRHGARPLLCCIPLQECEVNLWCHDDLLLVNHVALSAQPVFTHMHPELTAAIRITHIIHTAHSCQFWFSTTLWIYHIPYTAKGKRCARGEGHASRSSSTYPVAHPWSSLEHQAAEVLGPWTSQPLPPLRASPKQQNSRPTRDRVRVSSKFRKRDSH